MKQRRRCVNTRCVKTHYVRRLHARRVFRAALLCALFMCAALGASSCETLVRAFADQTARNAADALWGK